MNVTPNSIGADRWLAVQSAPSMNTATPRPTRPEHDFLGAKDIPVAGGDIQGSGVAALGQRG